MGSGWWTPSGRWRSASRTRPGPRGRSPSTRSRWPTTTRWAGGYGLFLPADPKVLYLSRMEEPLWWTRLADGTLFVQYNRVEFLEPALLRDLVGAGDRRRTSSGSSSTSATTTAARSVRSRRSWTRSTTPKVDRPGRLFLITGRNTYSAAGLFAAELQARTVP